MKFKHGTRRRALEYEKDWLKKWKENKIFEKSVENRPADNQFVFYDGPPFLTGTPHHGHLLVSTAKDAIGRFQTMKGKRVERTWGWDCHGLPAEVYVEKELGIKNKEEIGKKISIPDYVSACRSAMVKTSTEWEDTIDRLGRWVEFEGAYKTMDKEYMESVWWAFKTLYDKGKIYEGEKILVYCTKDATPISKSEVAMENSYQTVTDPSVYVKFKIVRDDSHAYFSQKPSSSGTSYAGSPTEPSAEQQTNQSGTSGIYVAAEEGKNSLKNKYFESNDVCLLAWTTTPWTLPANVALAVNPDMDYVAVEHNGEILIMAKSLVEEVMTDEKHQPLDYKIIREMKGAELVGLEYEPLFDVGDSQRGFDKTIAEIRDKDFDKNAPDFDDSKLWKREAVRAILLNSENKVALMYSKKSNYYKLPGGGVEEGESKEGALRRETLEEVGTDLVITGEVGKIEEFRTFADNQHQTSYAYIARAVGEIGNNHLEDNEKAEGFEPVWVDLDEAIELVKSGNVASERGIAQRFMTARDEMFLREYKKISEKSKDTNAYKVYPADYVSDDGGTGIVHIAPAYGEEDFELSRKYNLPVVSVVDASGNFTDGPWRGENIWKINKQIAKDMHEQKSMNFLREIEYRKKETPKNLLKNTEERAVRCIVFDKNGRVALIHSKKHDYYDLPGGGVERGEGYKEAALREMQEEIGYRVKNLTEIGDVLVYMYADSDIRRINRGYSCQLAEKAGEPKFDDHELTEDFETVWVDNVDEAIKTLSKQKDAYQTKRDLAFLEEYKKMSQAGTWRGAVWKIDYIRHEYPHCHRCGTKLMYRAHPSWFMDIAGQKQEMLKANENTRWVPDNLRIGRFHNIIEQAPDWNLSRDRYWATPIPVWKGEKADGTTVVKVIGSYDEFEEVTGFRLDDYHLPQVMDVTFEHEGATMRHIGKVLDCWFESGSMPFAQFHYPFENKEKFEKSFPADFITEAIDQTRGWFYSLMAVSVGLFGKAPWKNLICTGFMNAADGKKMSKKLKNYTDPMGLMDKFSADSFRFLMLSSPLMNGENFALKDKDVGDVARKLSMIWNMYDFFTMYAEVDGWEFNGELTDPLKDLTNPLDKWVVSRLHEVVTAVEQALENYDFQEATKPILPFVDDASNWYVRRSRRRFWKSEDDDDKNQAYRTLHYVLTRLAIVLAPFTPFLTEELYQKMVGGESVHLLDWLPAGKVDEKILEEMSIVRSAINEGLRQRAENGLKVRQPLQAAIVYSDNQAVSKYADVIMEELNLKDIVFEEPKKDGEAQPIIYIATLITDELKREGLAREVIRFIQNARKKAELNVDDRIVLSLSTGSSELKRAIDEFSDEIAHETLAKFGETKQNLQTVKIDDAELEIALEKRNV